MNVNFLKEDYAKKVSFSEYNLEFLGTMLQLQKKALFVKCYPETLNKSIFWKKDTFL